MTGPIPRPGVGAPPYAVPRAGAPVDLPLDANEGAAPDPTLLASVEDPALALGRYPSARALEASIAGRLGTAPEQVLVTAGADDALDRICRAVLGPGLRALLPEPGFAMLRRYVELTGAEPVSVPWPEGPLPVGALIEAVDDNVRLIAVTSPNNPTGAVATIQDLRDLSRAAPQALLLVDLAYVEFADHDLTAAALALPNAVLTRTFSKAWGLAGLRVGYAAGPSGLIGWLRGIGLPYAVSGLSLALVQRALEDEEPMRRFVARVRANRAVLDAALREAGARPQASQANFILARVQDDPLWWRDGLAGLGIGIRAFPGVQGLHDAIRIAVPGEAADLSRVIAALRTLRAPEAVLVAPGVSALGAGEGRALSHPRVAQASAMSEQRFEVDVRPIGEDALRAWRGPAWALVATAAEVAAARAARVLPIAVGADGASLIARGAARAFPSVAEAITWVTGAAGLGGRDDLA